MALGYRPSYMDFSWISQLPDLVKAEQEDRQIKAAFGSGIDWNDPKQIEKIANTLGSIGTDKSLKLSMGLGEMANKRREAAEQAAREARGQQFFAGQAGPTEPTRYTDAVRAAATDAGLPEGAANLAVRIQRQESGNREPTVTSSAGAVGPMQLMPRTAQAVGVQNITDPQQNIAGGTRHLGDLWNKYGGNDGLAAAAYHAGEANVNAFLAGQRSGVGPKTQAYVRATTGRPLSDWVAAAADPSKMAVFGAEDLGAKYKAASSQMPLRAAEAGFLMQGKVSPGTAQSYGNVQKEDLERQSKEIETDTKEFREYQGEVYKKRGEASTVTGLLDRAEKLVNDPRTFQGTGSDVLARVGSFVGVADQIAKQFGINLPLEALKKPVANVEELRGLSNQIVLSILGGKLGAQVSNTDRQFVQDAQASIGNSPEANRMLIAIARKAAQRDKEVAAMTAAYYDKGGRSRAQLERHIAQYAEANPLVTAADRAVLERDKAQGGAQPPPQGGAQLPAGAPSVIYKGGKPVKVIGVGPDGTLITEDQAPRVPAGGI